MTPKQKAKDLFNKYYMLVEIKNYDNTKQCVLIAVDEIIEALQEYDNRNNTYELQNMDRDFNYWQQVKQEIEKL